MATPTKPKTGPCAICDEIKSRKLVKGLEVCSTCAHMFYAAHGHPARLIRALTMAGNQCMLVDESAGATEGESSVIDIKTQDGFAMLEAECLALKEQLANTQQELVECMKDHSSAVSTRESLECGLAKLNGELESSLSEIVELQSTIFRLEEDLSKLNHDHDFDHLTISTLLKITENMHNQFFGQDSVFNR